MIIVGAGMAGLLAGQMLRRHQPIILERQASLPNNHAALLRFRTDAVAQATGIDFRQVAVRKAVYRKHSGISDVATLADSNEYARKVTGEVSNRSILDLAGGTRYIAPEDFINQMSRGLDIKYDCPFADPAGADNTPIISTMPMPVLMELVGWENQPTFRWRPIWTVTGWVEGPRVNVYQTLYYPADEWDGAWYRASITGNRVTIEYVDEPDDDTAKFVISLILGHFGITAATVRYGGITRQEYGKLIPLEDEQGRKAFIMAMTDQYNIWSLGRFATWRQIVLDDVVEDIRFIDRVLSTRDTYARRLHSHTS